MRDDKYGLWCGPNDGGIKRGDRADTGDEQAGPNDGVSERGSGIAEPQGGGLTGHATDDPLGYSAAEDIDLPMDEDGMPEEIAGADIGDDDLTIMDASDGRLGLTNVGTRGPDDWAADTGPTHTGEENDGGKTSSLADESSTLNPGGRRSRP